ncbi:Holliday junction resolvase RuvX [Pseudanabaena sp. PCC 6802]|uniref:Holliday junction resolvase RuvX n=1 Tax=Pseudanabaena sp. PCC 6802 TaxID=118173 RepID=UPI00034AFBCC|nr:Holliday junction resolvase RuvX [Pseudanabaena sp. PCC 6802]
MLLGFDPGKDKCGVAVIGLDRQRQFLAVVPSSEAIAQIQDLLGKYPISLLVMGNLTTSKQWQAKLKENFPNLLVVTVDESHSSQEARQRYWELYPPKGIMKLVPLGMRSPSRPVDDIVAIILVERYLNRLVS